MGRDERPPREHFALFAAAYPDLALYGRLARGLAADAATADLLLAAQPGQRLPVLLFAAVHDLVLRRPELPLARWYPSVTGEPVPADDPYPEFRATCAAFRDELREVIATSRTQTNEVNRAVLLAPLLAAACADLADEPIALVELGSSAGLLLGVDRYEIRVGAARYGDPSSTVRCAGELRGGEPPAAPFPPSPPIVDRVGVDLDPVDLGDSDRVRWLEACLWPDVAGRVERFRAAAELCRRHRPRLVRADFVDGLVGAVASLAAAASSHLVVMHSWALCYTPRPRRERLAVELSALAAARPVSWISAEPPGCVPEIVAPRSWLEPPRPGAAAPDTVLGLRRWRSGAALSPAALGVSHPHGAWLAWSSTHAAGEAVAAGEGEAG